MKEKDAYLKSSCNSDPNETTIVIAHLAHRGNIVDDVDVSQSLDQNNVDIPVAQRLRSQLPGIRLRHRDAAEAFGHGGVGESEDPPTTIARRSQQGLRP